MKTKVLNQFKNLSRCKYYKKLSRTTKKLVFPAENWQEQVIDLSWNPWFNDEIYENAANMMGFEGIQFLLSKFLKLKSSHGPDGKNPSGRYKVLCLSWYKFSATARIVSAVKHSHSLLQLQTWVTMMSMSWDRSWTCSSHLLLQPCPRAQMKGSESRKWNPRIHAIDTNWIWYQESKSWNTKTLAKHMNKRDYKRNPS